MSPERRLVSDQLQYSHYALSATNLGINVHMSGRVTLIRGKNMQKCIVHIRVRNPFAVFKRVTNTVVWAGGNDVYIIGYVLYV